MEFNKSRVYTAVNADELEPGDKVICANDMGHLKHYVTRNGAVLELQNVLDENNELRFAAGTGKVLFALAYPIERMRNCTNCDSHEVCGYTQNVSKFACLNRCEHWKPKTEQKANCSNCTKRRLCDDAFSKYRDKSRCDEYEAESKTDKRDKNTKRNLCDSCKHSFAECPATINDIIFGDGIGNDNVYECYKYEKKPEMPELISLGNGQYVEKVEKHYRPFKDTDELIKVWEEKTGATPYWGKGADLFMPYIWVQRKGMSTQELITGFDKECMDQIKIDGVWRDMQSLFNMYTFLDDSPCGIDEYKLAQDEKDYRNATKAQEIGG